MLFFFILCFKKIKLINYFHFLKIDLILSQVTQQILMNYPSSLSYLVTSSIWRTKGRWRNLVAMKQSRGYFLTDPPLLENIRFLKNLISTIKISRIEQAQVYSFKCSWQWVFVFWGFFGETNYFNVVDHMGSKYKIKISTNITTCIY